MLEILKANVLIAYQQLEQYQLDRYGRGVVSAIDRNRDMVAIKTAQQSVLVSLKDDNWKRELDAETISNIRTHIALYRAFPQIGGIARPHARNATIFAQLGMDTRSCSSQVKAPYVVTGGLYVVMRDDQKYTISPPLFFYRRSDE